MINNIFNVSRHKNAAKINWKPLLCDPLRIRTWDLLLRRQLLYPAELVDQYLGRKNI